MRSFLTAIQTVLCATAFVLLMPVWLVSYLLEGALDNAVAWLVDHWPQD